MDLVMVMPAYNEAGAIQDVLKDWLHVFDEVIGCEPDAYAILVVNDGSLDDTALKVAELEDPHVMLVNQRNGGHGRALYAGYMKAVGMKPDYVFQTDSDGQTNPDEFRPMWDARDENIVIMGYRRHREDGLFRMLSTRVLRMVFTMLFHRRVVDSNTPFRLMPYGALMKALREIQPNPDFTNILLTGAWVHDDVPIRFVEISFRPRDTGVNSVNVRNMGVKGMDAIMEMLALRKRLRNRKEQHRTR